MERRTITTERLPEEEKMELSLRPRRLSEYIGQEELKAMLKVYIEAAKSRKEPLDHVVDKKERY